MSVEVMSEFHAATRVEGECAVLALEGELDFAVQQQARAAIERASDARVLVIDLRDLTFMDTSGIHLLLETRDRCRASGRMLLIVRGSALVHRGLAVLGLEHEFEFVDAP
jgi:anti-sigma B factor antagonist